VLAFDAVFPDLLEGMEEEVAASPICMRSFQIYSDMFKWRDGIMHSGTSKDAYPEFTGADDM
jgi:hypothetical protein